ncbi:MAG: cob(I)yrinic acid a,c-diamide adenosyltransferase [Prolixibacteraceae bacterium]|nr:cob(I)yrinic acid a,c-diamide adenosyltransferase [Prolixibacteraceae bacterium]
MNKFKIYTKTGDNGSTGLIGGTRVDKSDIRLEAYGTIDELNSWLGLIRSSCDDENLKERLFSVQNCLFIIGSNLATDEDKSDLRKQLFIKEEKITELEKEIDIMQEILPPLNNFIIPGGSICSGYIHIARTVCRRAERRIAVLNNEGNNTIIKYINRLSDYLFVLSRYVNYKNSVNEVFWVTEKS